MTTTQVLKLGVLVLSMSSLLAAAPAPVFPASPDRPLAPGDPGTGAQTTLPGDASMQAKPAVSSNGPAADIRDIRGPREIPDPWKWVPYAAGALFALLLLYGAWRAFGRRKRRAKLAHERAFEGLERARAFMQPEHAREFCFRVSDVVRRYIEDRFSVRSTQQTTAEFLHYVSEHGSGPLVEHRALLNEFLESCDLVKFAGWGLTEVEMQAMFQSAWQFVDATKPEEAVSGVRSLATGLPAHRRTSDTGHRTPTLKGRTPDIGDRTPTGAPETGPNPMVGGVS